MTPEEVLNYYGTGNAFHKATGMSHASLYNWINRGYVPETSQYKLERLTNGKLKADGKTTKELETKEEILRNAHHILKFSFMKEITNFIKKYCVPSSKIYPDGEQVIKNVLNELIKERKGKKR